MPSVINVGGAIVNVGGSSSIGNDTTFGDLIEKVYRRVMGGVRERTVQIDNTGGLDSDDDEVVVIGPQANSMAPGVILSVEMELMYVTEWNPAINTATVIRGYFGSNQTAHEIGTVCYINPRYSRYDIGVAINDDLRSLSSPTNGLFRVGVAQLTYNPVFSGYDLGNLPDNFIDILEIRYRIAPPYRTFPAIKKWKVVRGVPDPVFPSGHGLIIHEPAWPGLPIYVMYSAPFIKLVDTGDSVLRTPGTNDEAPPVNGYSQGALVANLRPTMIDLPVLGAQIDLTLPREISRNFMESQPDPRKAQEVPPNAVASSVAAMQLRRQQRISEEADRLTRQYTRVRAW